ncbi:ATP-binding domain-containing protein [Thiorhodococcus mannitoliphagus]|uniref:DNA 3'-5' helicase II n=1 Tax=Thiorhodococcus mannitoliphagus TaxID=329406 RepID=A0A6P1DLA8_9GAMM|nr:ATP-binding domain-containing protein [Thiorhodococcus mannitoliphagus]NEX19017.1 ATP-binding domain-containing protein [Thiorhodococcus mannitoliphagus]
MAARSCSLPNIQDLSKEQERARLLPLEGCHLVVGGPGTGKSVLALLRTRRHHRKEGGQRYVFLVYNKLLLEASRELEGGSVNACTWISWFKSMYARTLSQPCPLVDGKPYSLDWPAIKEAILGAPELKPPLEPFLVIDEGQDMPKEFYHALAELGFEHFYVVADQNQQITDECSLPREIAAALDIDFDDRIVLTENFRNCDRVARLALEFCVARPDSPCVELPKARPCVRAPILVDYGPGCRWDYDELVARVLKLADRNPAKLIGIITPNNKSRARWFNALRGHPVTLDHGRPRILTYASGSDGGDHRFAEGGIFVINAQSSKGLEFDTVFLADIHEYSCPPDNQDWMDDLKRRFYVMVSRAREQVILLRQSGRGCPVEVILPADQDTLRRWR